MGRLTFDLMSIVSTAVARHDATETIIGVGPSTVIHDQDILSSETRLVAELGLTSWFAASAVLPLRVFNTSIRYLDTNGQEVSIENPFIHHHNETLVGIGDPWLLGRAAMQRGGFTLAMRLGATLPLGRTEPDPFLLGDMGLPHEHSQFGSGTLQPVIGIDAARSFGDVRLDAFALTVQSLYANGHGYQAGDRYAAGFGGASSLGTKRWRFRLTFEAQHETAERWHGLVHEDEGNIGRTDALAGAELTFRLNEDWHLGASVKVPVYTHVEGGQLEASPFAGLSVGTHFHVFDKEHTHAHHPMPEVALVPVPGKITVFDYWATWCAPCSVVDHELTGIVKRHPDDIAVQKIEVIDESPYTLPYLKVFGRDGTLLWERNAPPLALTADVEKLVAPPAPRPKVVAGAVRIPINVGDKGYAPDRIEIEHGRPAVLVFTRTSDKTCATDVHFVLPDGTRIDEELPLNHPVEIPLTIEKPGEIVYSCGMNMNHGTIVVK